MESKHTPALRWLPQPFESFLEALPPSLKRKTLLGMSYLAGIAYGTDFYIHEPYGVSNPARRAIVTKLFGPEITSHLGNTLISGLIMSAFMFAGEQSRNIGEQYDNDFFRGTSDLAPITGLLVVAGLNFAETNLANQPNPQGIGDLIFGFTAAMITGIVLTNHFQEKREKESVGDANGVHLNHAQSPNHRRGPNC